MKHLFSSGEVMYQKNEKQLAEGVFKGDYLEYDEVEPNTSFKCVGKLDEQPAEIAFMLSDEDFDGVKSRYMFRILMQSDIFLSNWKSYKVSFTDPA
ncbi:MAG: hypothetical protein N2376_08535 [Clostridia bacterium]|nr:hypothetical protein [Clostridia bacterium]